MILSSRHLDFASSNNIKASSLRLYHSLSLCLSVCLAPSSSRSHDCCVGSVSLRPVWPAVASHVCVRRTRLTVCLLTYLVYKSGYGVWITWLFIGFPCSTVLFLFQFFSIFSFLNRFPLQFFSSLLLSTPIYSYLPHYWFVSWWFSLIIIIFSSFSFS